MRKFWIFWDQWSFGIFWNVFYPIPLTWWNIYWGSNPYPNLQLSGISGWWESPKNALLNKDVFKTVKMWYVMTASIENQGRFVRPLLCSFLYNHLFIFMFIFEWFFCFVCFSTCREMYNCNYIMSLDLCILFVPSVAIKK